MLQKTMVPVIFEGALDQKTGDKLSSPGKFLILQNAVRRKTGLLEKRFGFTSLSKTWFNANSVGGTISSAVGFVPYRDNLVLLDSSLAYLYSTAQSGWTSVRTSAINNITTSQLSANGPFMTEPDICKVGNYVIAAWVEPSSSTKCLFYAIYEDVTFNVIVPPTSFASGAGVNSPRVAGLGTSTVLIAYRNSGTSKLNWLPIDLTAPHTTPSSTVYSTVNMDDLPWDLVSFDANQCIVSFSYAGGTNTRVMAINAAGVYAGKDSALGVATGGPMTLVSDPTNDRFYLLHIETDLDAFGFVGSTFAISSGLVIGAPVAGFSYSRVTGVADPATGTIYVFSDNGTGLFQMQYNETQFIDTWKITKWSGAGVMSKTDVIVDHKTIKPQTIVSKAFWDGTYAYVYGTFESGVQSTYYVIRHDGHTVSRFAEGAAGGIWKTVNQYSDFETNTNSYEVGTTSLPSVFKDSNNCYVSTLSNVLDANQVFSGSIGIAYSLLFIDLLAYRFNPNPTICAREFQHSLYIAGGMPKVFDGSYLVEQGFNQTLESITLADGGAGAGMAAGTYSIALTYEWYDSLGLRHQSSPSAPVTRTIAINHSIIVTIPMILNMSEYPKNEGRTSGGTSIGTRAIIWVSAPNAPDTLYRYGDTVTGTYQTFNPVDTTREILYTTGGIYPNDPAPSCTCLHVHKNRLWLGGLVTSQIAYSKTLSETVAVAFSDNNRIDLESEGGDVTAFGSLDDKLVIFKADRFYYIMGEGPLDSGQQNDYPEPIRIPSTVGTIYPNSVIEIPTGLLFKSQKGWMILRRNLTTEYIGAPVEDFNSLTVTSASIVQTYNEVRFTHSDGSVLVYNLDFGQWMEWTNYTAIGGVSVASGYYHAKSNGTVNREVSGQYNDNGTTIDLVAETSWLSMARLQGFQRLWEMLLIGDFFNNFHLKLSIAYDFQTSYNQVITKDTTGLANGPILQLRIQPAIQKCQAFKLKIETIDDVVGGGGANFKPTALTLAIGRKRGVYKVSTVQTI